MKNTITLIITLIALTSLNAFSADKEKGHDKKMPMMTHEERLNMATAHEKMATCLRSDRSVEECHKEMMQACKDTMGKDGCPMMGKMHKMGKDMMDDKEMMDYKDTEKKK